MEMNRSRIATGLSSVLLLAGSSTRQGSATPAAQAASQSPGSESENAPCQPRAAISTTPFDTCKYLPLGPGIRPPRASSIVDPEYSDAARKARINGSVVLAVAISEKGDVDMVRIVRSLDRQLDQNAMDAAKRSKFVPATRDGKPVAVQLNMEMTFKLY
jgi:TonB family protein